MELKGQIRDKFIVLLREQRDELNELIACLEQEKDIALVPVTHIPSGRREIEARVPLRKEQKQKTRSVSKRRKPGRPRGSRHLPKPVKTPGAEEDFGKCSIEAIEALLRGDGDGGVELSAADIMSGLKRKWNIEANYRTVMIVLSKGQAARRFKRNGDLWRLA